MIHGNDNYNVKNDGIITKFGVKNVINEQKFVAFFVNMACQSAIVCDRPDYCVLIFCGATSRKKPEEILEYR